MYRYIFLLAFFSCGSRVELPAIDVDPALEPFLVHYLEVAPDVGRIGALRKLRFGDLEPRYMGVCAEYTAGGREWSEVVISPNLPGYMLVVVVYHELLHCVHGRGHTEDPDAIMAPYIRWDAEYWEANLDEQLAASFAEGVRDEPNRSAKTRPRGMGAE
jgi:hypothetical protein